MRYCTARFSSTIVDSAVSTRGVLEVVDVRLDVHLGDRLDGPGQPPAQAIADGFDVAAETLHHAAFGGLDLVEPGRHPGARWQ